MEAEGEEAAEETDEEAKKEMEKYEVKTKMIDR